MVETSKALLEFVQISKAFGKVQANSQVSFAIQKGSIHAVVGENGAGKSTIMKVLFGIYQPDSGQIKINGKTVEIQNPIQAKTLGIGMVHQHFMLAGPITALDHIILDQKNESSLLANLFSALDRKKVYGELSYLSQKYGMPVPWDKAIDQLPVGIQQRIEIMKLLYNQSEILILDEPTAVLTPQEVDEFFKQLRALKSAGKTIIIITHKLKEVLALADTVTVMRQGAVTHSGPIQGHTIESLSELMIGRKPGHLEKISFRQPNQMPLLDINDFTFQKNGAKILDKIQLQVFAGEVVGLAGVEGNGQYDLLQAITRPLTLDGETSGSIKFKQVEVSQEQTSQIRALGLGYLAEDRLHQAILVDTAAAENYLLGQQWREDLRSGCFINQKQLLTKTEKAFLDFDVRPHDINLNLGKFSGGNQQKFVVAREIEQNPDLLIAAQPTRGVDIGASEAIHTSLVNLKKSQKAVLLVSSDLDETLKLSDRIYVLFRGKIAAELLPDQFDETKIGALMGGATP